MSNPSPRSLTDTTAINDLIARGKQYAANNDSDSALYYLQMSLQKSRAAGFSRGILSSLVNLGVVCKNSGNYEDAITYYNEGVSVARKTGSPATLSMFYNNLANVYTRISLTDSALQYYSKSLAIKISENDKKGIVNIYTNLGTLQASRQDFVKAKNYFEQGLKLAEEIGNTGAVMKLYGNIGNVYYETGKTDSAELFYRKVLESGPSGVLRGLEGLYLNMGNIFLRRNEFDSALAYYKKSFSVNEETGDRYRMADDLNNIAYTLLQQGNIKQAISYYRDALTHARDINSADQQKVILGSLAECYAKNNNYQLAYIYSRKSDSIAADLFDQERQKQIEEMLVKFETAEKEKQLLQQKALNEKKTYERNAFILTSIFLLAITCIVVFVYVRTRSMNKKLSMQKAIIEKREHEKELLLRELHHRTKNNLQIVSSLLNLQANKLSDTEAVHAVREGQARVEAMALIHRDLYRNENVTKVNIRAYLENMVNNLMNSYDYSEAELRLHQEVEDVELEADLAIPVGLIANELISNAFKHAFRDQDHPELIVVVRETDNSELHMLVRDNGPGLSESNHNNTFGMSMIHSLVRQLNGAVSFENLGGCAATLEIPLKKETLTEA